MKFTTKRFTTKSIISLFRQDNIIWDQSTSRYGIDRKTWWRHQMDTISALLALCEGNHRSPVDSPHKGHTGHRWIPLTRASDAERWCFLDLHLNKRLSKHSRRRRFETPSRSLWRHRNGSGFSGFHMGKIDIKHGKHNFFSKWKKTTNFVQDGNFPSANRRSSC